MDPVLIGFIAYLVLVVVVGLLTYGLNRTGEDYLLAGRSLPTWVATFSERASGEEPLAVFAAASLGVSRMHRFEKTKRRASS